MGRKVNTDSRVWKGKLPEDIHSQAEKKMIERKISTRKEAVIEALAEWAKKPS